MVDNISNLHEHRNRQAATREQVLPQDLLKSAIDMIAQRVVVPECVVITFVGEVHGEPGALNLFAGPNQLDMVSALMEAGQDVLESYQQERELGK